MPIGNLISVYQIFYYFTAAELPSTSALQQQNSSGASIQPLPGIQHQLNQFNYAQSLQQNVQFSNESVTLQQGKEVLGTASGCILNVK